MRLHQLHIRQWIAGRTAKLMFSLSLVFLFCQAVLVVLWADVPMLVETALREIQQDTLAALRLKRALAASAMESNIQSTALAVMTVTWPFVILESIFHWLSRPWDSSTRKYHLFSLLYCICPSLRLCARCPELGERIWLPGLGWRKSNRRLRTRLERQFSVPMIMIALLIMPVLIVEFFMKNQVAQHTWLRLALHVSTGMIWFAFAAEFILMVSIADKKLSYCKKHWIDLAIILLPFISFLRTLRILRVSRAATLLQFSQISKIARVYRLRGTAVKALRGLILLDLFARLGGGQERTIHRMQRRLEDLETEARLLRRKITRLRRQRAERGDASFPADSEIEPDDSHADSGVGEVPASKMESCHDGDFVVDRPTTPSRI